MRIAVSGTHSVGKSTLICEFLRAHPEFAHEAEPYEVLVEEFGEEFAAEPGVEDFRRQLDFNIERLAQHPPGAKVIYERCPLDFLAYIQGLQSNSDETLADEITNALRNLDLIVYLPLDESDAEFPKLRRAVDRRLSAIYREDQFELPDTLTIIEATGSTAQRLRTLESYTSNTQPSDASQRITS